MGEMLRRFKVGIKLAECEKKGYNMNEKWVLLNCSLSFFRKIIQKTFIEVVTELFGKFHFLGNVDKYLDFFGFNFKKSISFSNFLKSFK